ncbi:MAG: DUF1501 domain-containing protein [Alphaproteobacteria bacterium]|nr:DUF1501 domain-containing protein [Alphaproteobacteria bacterium]
MLTRRQLLTASAATLGGLTLGARRLRADPAPEDLRLIFFVVSGGWDPTRVFADAFDDPAVAMEPDAERASLGALRWVHHPERPSVTRFFEDRAQQLLVVNGIQVPSVSHRDCSRIILAGDTAAPVGSWPALISSAQADRFPLPHVVVRGPSVPGRYASAVTRLGAEGEIDELLTGALLQRGDAPAEVEAGAHRALIEARVSERLAAEAAAPNASRAALAEALASGDARARAVLDRVDEIRWAEDTSVASQVEQGVDLLRLGLSRTLTISNSDPYWDSHVDNDYWQSLLLEALFGQVEALMQTLEGTTGPLGVPLSEHTAVVLMSEMGRTPYHNSVWGKDHWQHTSAMLIGPGFNAGQTVGGFDPGLTAAYLDAETGQPAPGGRRLHARRFGATLLAAAGVDPEPLLGEAATPAWLA